MAFTSVKTKVDVMGSHRVVMGTFAQASGDTGGVINTGLRVVDNFQMNSAKSVTVSGGTVTVVTPDPVATVGGFWIATGM